MKFKLLIFLAIILTAVFIVGKIPANAILSQQQIKLAGFTAEKVEGTLWQGKAQNIKYKNLDLDEVDWELTPVSIATFGNLGNVEIKTGNSIIKAKVNQVVDKIELREITGTVNLVDAINLAQKYHNFTVPLTVTGVLKLDLSDVIVNKNRKPESVNGKLDLSNLNIGGQEVRGNYKLILKTANKIINARLLSEGQSDLDIAATASFTHSGKYQADGRLKATTSTPQEILSLLKFIGIDNKQQSKNFKRAGQLRLRLIN